MVMAFYVSAIVALLSTMQVIATRKPIHGLLYLVVSLLAVAMIFFAVELSLLLIAIQRGS